MSEEKLAHDSLLEQRSVLERINAELERRGALETNWVRKLPFHRPYEATFRVRFSGIPDFFEVIVHWNETGLKEIEFTQSIPIPLKGFLDKSLHLLFEELYNQNLLGGWGDVCLQAGVKLGSYCLYHGNCTRMIKEAFCTETRLRVCDRDRERYLKGTEKPGDKRAKMLALLGRPPCDTRPHDCFVRKDLCPIPEEK